VSDSARCLRQGIPNVFGADAGVDFVVTKAGSLAGTNELKKMS